MTLPNFLIIGAAKSGTTSLYHYLKEHPQVFLPPGKELKFFAMEGECGPFRRRGHDKAGRQIITDLPTYQAVFNTVSDEIAIGEASNDYLWSKETPQRIQSYLPDVKLIVILRHPVERAYSEYLMYRRERWFEPIDDFGAAIRAEMKQPDEPWSLWTRFYVRGGFYYRYLKRYYDRFNHSQIKVYLLDDLRLEPLRLMHDLYQFLQIDAEFVPNLSIKHNLGGRPRSRFIYLLLTDLIMLIRQGKPISKPTGKDRALSFLIRRSLIHRLFQCRHKLLTEPEILAPPVRQQLLGFYQADTLQLQDLIQRDLSHWLV